MSVDWSRTEEVMHKPLRNTWQPPSVYYFQPRNKRFVEEFIPGEDHDDLKLFMLLGYGDGLKDIRTQRKLFGTIETIYFNNAYEALVGETAKLIHTQDTDTAQQLGHDYAFWIFDQHKQQFTRRFSLSETEEETETLDYVSYGEHMNYYNLHLLMQENHKQHTKPAVISVALVA